MCEERKRQAPASSEPELSETETECEANDCKQIKHMQFGVWDYYEEVSPKLWGTCMSGRKWREQLNTLQNDIPYVWMMLKDLSSLESTWTIFTIYASIGFVLSLFPVITFWYSGQLLKIVSNVEVMYFVLRVTGTNYSGRDSGGRESS